MAIIEYAIVTAVGKAVLVLCPPLAGPIANILGIHQIGIAAGGMAAVAQSYVGNLAPGCVIAALQSAAMGPAAAAPFFIPNYLIVPVVIGIIAAVKKLKN
nr:uncharacterized protein LOC106678640 [Halyomorpha halys]